MAKRQASPSIFMRTLVALRKQRLACASFMYLITKIVPNADHTLSHPLTDISITVLSVSNGVMSNFLKFESKLII